MVSVFFVISGYVLSVKVLGLAREGRYPEVYKSVASSVFRRGLRLFVSCEYYTTTAKKTSGTERHATKALQLP